MNKSETASNIIFEMSDMLRGTLNGNDLIFGCLKLLFLKYVVDNYLGATTPKEIKYYANAQTTFARRNIDDGTEFITPILTTLDNYFLNNTTGVFFSERLLDDYGTLLLGTDKRKNKINTDNESFKRIMEFLGTLNLEDDENQTLGKNLVDAYIDKLTNDYYRSKIASEIASTMPLSEIAAGILQVNDKDVFCDFTAGVGVSTIAITKNSMPKVVCSDKNQNAVVMTAMVLVMYGYKDFEVLLDDSLTNGAYFNGANKIFVDPPIGMRIDSIEEKGKIESQIMALRDIKRHLSVVSGRAIIAVPSGTLFQATGRAVQIRKELIEQNLVEAVVSLPPLWNGSALGTNLIVLNSSCSNQILLVDAVASKAKEEFYDGNMKSEGTINFIVDVVNSRKEIEGFSKLVDISELDETCNLVPTNYIERIRKTNYRSLSEVDKELSELYGLLNIKL